MLLKGVLLPVFEGENYSESARPRASQHNLFALLIRADLVILRQLVKHSVNEGITFHLIITDGVVLELTHRGHVTVAGARRKNDLMIVNKGIFWVVRHDPILINYLRP